MTGPILVEVSPNPGVRHAANGGAVIGRDDCEIALVDDEVSRRHAAIRAVGDRVEIEDLGSRNGTYVNDRRIDRPRRLSAGDQIRVGETTLQLEVAGSPAANERRGDVPAPEITPTVVREAPPLEAVGPPVFRRARPRKIRGSAARIGWATAISFAVVAATAVAVVLYLALR